MALKPLKTLNFGGEDTYYLKPEWKNIAETTVIGDTLTWDGNTEGLYGVDLMEAGINTHFLVSENVIPTDELTEKIDSTQVVMASGDVFTKELVEELGMPAMVDMFGNGKAYMLLMTAVVVYEDFTMSTTNEETGETSTYNFKKGLYFQNANDECVSSLTINGYNGFEMTETTPLPNKYLDFIETVKGDTLTWDGDRSKLEPIDSGDGIIWRISENSPSPIDWQNGGTITIDGSTESISSDVFVDTGAGFYILGDNLLWFIPNDITDGNGTVLVEKGVFVTETFVYNSLSLTINGYTGFTKTQIKQKYLPSGGGDVVVFNYDMDTNTINKSFAELHESVVGGRLVLGNMGGSLMSCAGFADNEVYFSAITVDGGAMMSVFIIIADDGTVTPEMAYYALTPLEG